MRTIELTYDHLKTKQDFLDFFNSEFSFEYPATNLDALYDNLTDSNEEVEFLLSSRNIEKICEDPIAYKMLMIVGDVIEANKPKFTVQFVSDSEA